MSLIGGRPMANDTDLLTSNDSDVSTACRNGETDGRQDSLVSHDMSSDGPDAATLRSATACEDKLDSYVANGCVKMREGTLECTAAVEAVVCRSASTTGDDEEVLKFSENAALVDNQRSTANGLVSPPSDKHAVKLTENMVVHSPQFKEICPNNYPSAAVSQTLSEVAHETVSVESAEKFDIEKQPNTSESSDCVCGLQPAALASDLSNLSIAGKDIGDLAVPCDDSVCTQLDTKHSEIRYIVYESETQMEAIMQLITRDLSEPYSIYTYRYFIHNWPKLCFLVCISEVVYILVILFA